MATVTRVCSISECTKKHKARGLCDVHYFRWRMHGTTDLVPYVRHNKGYRLTTTTGYIRVWEPDHPLAMKDGYVLEHRKVVHDAGIEIPQGCHVHHINGDKQDNRLENLEVLGASAHLRSHVAEEGIVVNQHGVWPIFAQATHCKNGHELNDANVWTSRDGAQRQCRVCHRDYQREWKRKSRLVKEMP